MAVLGEGCASPDSAGLDSLLQGITPPSFDFLPLELRLKCLANCDWQTLSRAACASRSTRALVAYLVRCPYWRTHAEEQSAVLCTQFESPEERQRACNNWAAELMPQLCGRGKPDLCFVFVSARSHDNLPTMLEALRANLARCTVLAGVVAPGVLGRGTHGGATREIDDVERVGLVVSVVHLPPGSTVHAAFIKDGLVQERRDVGWRPPEGDLPEGGAQHPRTRLVFSDRHSHIDGVLAELARRYPADTVVGGMGGGTDGGPSLLVGLPGRGKGEPLHASVTSGTVLLGISGPGVETIPLTARGMRCISQRFMVNQVNNNVDLSPVGRVTLVQQLQNCMPLATCQDKLTWVPVGGSFTPTSALVAALQAQGPDVAPRAPLFFGVREPGGSWRADDPGRMVMLQMHDPNNLMRTSGYVSVQHQVDRGMVAAFYTTHPDLSRRQLVARLADAMPEVYGTDPIPGPDNSSNANPFRSPDSIHTVLNAEPLPVYGCLLFPCVAKGSRYYGEAGVESAMVQATFPSASLAGFFCNGEIGPVPPDELVPDDGQAARMMGYSTVACMLKLVPAPPPPPDWSG